MREERCLWHATVHSARDSATHPRQLRVRLRGCFSLSQRILWASGESAPARRHRGPTELHNGHADRLRETQRYIPPAYRPRTSCWGFWCSKGYQVGEFPSFRLCHQAVQPDEAEKRELGQPGLPGLWREKDNRQRSREGKPNFMWSLQARHSANFKSDQHDYH